MLKLKLLNSRKLSHDTSGRAFVGKSISLIAVLEENRKLWTSLGKKQTHNIVSWKTTITQVGQSVFALDYCVIKSSYSIYMCMVSSTCGTYMS